MVAKQIIYYFIPYLILHPLKTVFHKQLYPKVRIVDFQYT